MARTIVAVERVVDRPREAWRATVWPGAGESIVKKIGKDSDFGLFLVDIRL
jgi:hypothetical protein